MRDTIKLLWKQSFCIPVSNLEMQKMLKSLDLEMKIDLDQNNRLEFRDD